VRRYVAVVGPGDATPGDLAAADAVGAELARLDAVLVCGGLGGVMEAAWMRNALVVRSADALVAVGRGYGTLSEIALALKARKPVVTLDSWDIDGVEGAATAEQAVAAALAALT
jgi:predicted Rossmann-fold nucleotide-binding protein